MAAVSKRLGHADLGTTSDIYSHLVGSASRDAAERATPLIPSASAHPLHTQRA
jgi:hypothetical protein